MSEEDKPKSKAQKEQEQKLADEAAEYIYEEILGNDEQGSKSTSEPAETSIATNIKNYVVDTGSAIATGVSEAVTAGQEYISGVNEGVSSENQKN